MSMIEDAANGFFNFIANLAPSPSNNPATQPSPQGGSGGDTGKTKPFDLIGGIAQVAAPLLVAAVSRPKPLPMPEQPKFPKVPDSVSNDPRVKTLLGAYGFPDNMPSIQPQKLTRPSAFQLAFPTMVQTAMQVYGDYRTAQQKQLDDQNKQNQPTTPTANSPMLANSAAAQVLNNATRFFPKDNPQQTVNSDANLDSMIGTKYTQNYDAVKQFDPLVSDAAKQHGVDANLLRAVMMNESGGDASAVGDGGKSFGLMQVQLPVARKLLNNPQLTAQELKDPTTNVNTAALFLKTLAEKYNNDYDKVIGAYNAGETKYDKGIYNPKYVAKARKNYLEFARIYANPTS